MITMPTIVSSITIPEILWGIFGLTLLTFCAYSLVLFYHWKTYGSGFYTGPLVSFVYLGISGIFLFTMAASLALL